MVTVEDIQAYLDRISYKPGWEFNAYMGYVEGPHFVIWAYLENSYQPGTMVQLDVHSALPPFRDLDEFDNWLRWRLIRLETHEVCEWLKRDGKPILDPHREGADKDRQPVATRRNRLAPPES